jgi:senataxin
VLLTRLIRYFGAFSDAVLTGFYNSFNEWELNMVMSALSRAGISSDASSDPPQIPLSNAPSAVVYHMVSNLQILRDSRILSIIRAHAPSDLLPSWPTDPPPAGMLILLVDENPLVRQWAKNQISKCKVVPIPKEKFVGVYTVAMDAVAHAVSAGTQSIGLSNSTTSTVTLKNAAIPASSSFSTSYAKDPADLWSGFCAFVRLIPPELLTSGTHHNVDLRRLVTGHLHDTGPRQ